MKILNYSSQQNIHKNWDWNTSFKKKKEGKKKANALCPWERQPEFNSLSFKYEQMMLEILIVTALFIHQLIYKGKPHESQLYKHMTHGRDCWKGYEFKTLGMKYQGLFGGCFFLPSLPSPKWCGTCWKLFTGNCANKKISYCGSWIFNEISSLSCCWPLDLDEPRNHLQSLTGQNLMIIHKTQPIPLEWNFSILPEMGKKHRKDLNKQS